MASSPEQVDPVGLVRLYHEAIEHRDYTALHSMFAVDATYSSNGVGSLKGRIAILDAFRAYFEDFADQVASDDSVERLSSHSGKSTWRLLGTSFRTGETLARRGVETVHFSGDGLIERVEVTDVEI